MYTFATHKLQPIVNEPAGRALIQTCLRCDLDCVLNVMTSATEDGMDQNDFGAMASMLYNSVAVWFMTV